MERMERIIHLTKDSIIESKLEIKDTHIFQIKDEVERISRIAKKNNKRDFLNLSNFEIFRLYMMLANYDLSYYDEMDGLLEEHKSIINRWSYEKEGQIIGKIAKKKLGRDSKDREFIEIIMELNLSPSLLEYYLAMPLQVINTFLRFKATVDELIRQSKSYIEVNLQSEIERTSFNKVGMVNMINAANECITDEVKNKQKNDENMRNRIKYSEELLEFIDSGKLDLLLAVPDEWHIYLDSKILEELYDIVNGNMLREYLNLLEEEQKLQGKINENPLKKYLISKELAYDTLDLDKQKILEGIPDIVEKIQYLESLGLDVRIILIKYIDVLISYDEEKVRLLEGLVKIGAIKRETIRDNLKELLGGLFDIVFLNYKILKDIIDFNNIFYIDTILFMDSHKLRNILSVLKEYNLSRDNYMFLLCNYEYIGIYDLMLEHNISLELLSSICKSSNPYETIKRIIVFMNIGEPYETSNHRLRKDVTNNGKFDLEIDDYLDNVIPFVSTIKGNGNRIDNVLNSMEVKELDEKYRVMDVYVIGGVRVSRGKFLRNYQKYGSNSNLISCLIKDSIMDSGDYCRLYNELNKKRILTK